jgi:hypothetical protein
VVSLSVEGRNVLTSLVGESPERRAEMIDKRVAGELRGLMGSYLAHLVGHRLKMQEYLG